MFRHSSKILGMAALAVGLVLATSSDALARNWDAADMEATTVAALQWLDTTVVTRGLAACITVAECGTTTVPITGRGTTRPITATMATATTAATPITAMDTAATITMVTNNTITMIQWRLLFARRWCRRNHWWCHWWKPRREHWRRHRSRSRQLTGSLAAVLLAARR